MSGEQFLISFSVIALFMGMPVKCSVCFSARAVKSVTTSNVLSLYDRRTDAAPVI